MNSNAFFIVLLQGDWVWLEPERPGEFDTAIGAIVKASEGGQLRLLDDDRKVHTPGFTDFLKIKEIELENGVNIIKLIVDPLKKIN